MLERRTMVRRSNIHLLFTQKLTPQTHTNTKPARQLLLNCREDGIDAVTPGPTGPQTTRIAVDIPSSAEHRTQKILEEAVYQAPQLMAEFAAIHIALPVSRFMFTPAHLAQTPEQRTAMAKKMWGHTDVPHETIAQQCRGPITALSQIPRSLAAFIHRTFIGAKIHNRLALLVDTFSTMSPPANKVKMFAHFPSPQTLDIVALSPTGLIMANTFHCLGPTDATYYTMACATDCGFDPLDDELVLCGLNTLTSQATTALRQYLNSVMPLLLPQPQASIPLELLSLYKNSPQ